MTQEPLELPSGMSPPSGDSTRFDRRWHLVGAGLSNVWLFGDLQLLAPTGRLLLRGPNGTGKTTALEALCPYLLDLNQGRLGAGKSRVTTLKSLMETGTSGKRRYGYLWLEFAGPGGGEVLSFGVRLQYSQGSSPAIVVVPFFVPGRPLQELDLHGPHRAPLTSEEFSTAVDALGGETFDDPEDYLTRLGTHVLKIDPSDIRLLAQRMRQVRNPSLLGEVTPREAADSLRESLPGVDPDIIDATGKALSESASTREAFARDARAADALADFAATWAGHVVNVATDRYTTAANRSREAQNARLALAPAAAAQRTATEQSEAADSLADSLADDHSDAEARVRAAERAEEYKAAGRIKDLQATAEVQADNAALQTGQLTRTASSIAEAGRRLISRATELSTDIDATVETAARADPGARPAQPPLSWHTVPRAVITVADVSADPGPAVRIDADVDRLAALANQWRELGQWHRSQAEKATLAVTDHRAVEDADRKASEAESEHDGKVSAATIAAERAMTAAGIAQHAAQVLAGALEKWAVANSDLTTGWWPDDIGLLSGAEPTATLAAAAEWAESAGRTAAELAGRYRSRAAAAAGRADGLRTAAADLQKEATALRSGRLLPLPRPAWAGHGDDNVAFGSAVEWRNGTDDAQLRALLESAMAAAGLLGATLDDGSVHTAVWAVAAAATDRPGKGLDAVLAANPDHPLADTVTAVLGQIEYAATSLSADSATAPLVIGADGTFRAGILRGRAPGADAPDHAPPASHVGARQRRAAALAEADRLDAEADGLTAAAAAENVEALRLSELATDIQRRAAAFPPRKQLSAAESDRVRLATNAREAATDADATDQLARRLRSTHQAEARDWTERTRLLGLPTDLDDLARLRDNGARSAAVLQDQATCLEGRSITRVRDLIADAEADDRAAAALPTIATRARAAHAEAVGTEAELHHLQLTAGASAQQALREHAEAQQAEQQLKLQAAEATRVARDRSNKLTIATGKHETAVKDEATARPAATHAVDQLRKVLEVPDVAVCLGLGDGITDLSAEDLLTTVATALVGRRTNARKTVRERYDQARADLAGTWALEPGNSYDELDTYVLTHEDQTYTPYGAAARARALKDRAESALAAAEESALRDFVIGRLPSAIGVAWQRLHDWNTLVNRKMRTATASSGVGVQVRVRLRDDLSPAARVAYTLSCTMSDADRGFTEQQEVGQALQSLLAAAPGATMEERVAAAVDIRDWVSVHYEVERPGQKPQRWGSRTGLSGGERRLVVLAPMLAAIAASYDRADSDGLRLAALDEVPAEVDEEGRTALARYLAELDVDLLCTSYLWDGAPGAWDGIDAHDLEKDIDGTVVGFPMLVRGLLGDEMMPDAR
ncbi:MAG: SbcC/MukB-like Walker B domain-containing protein [Pseudonocardiaceae bacterium]